MNTYTFAVAGDVFVEAETEREAHDKLFQGIVIDTNFDKVELTMIDPIDEDG